jgi:hypothetical protein
VREIIADGCERALFVFQVFAKYAFPRAAVMRSNTAVETGSNCAACVLIM